MKEKDIFRAFAVNDPQIMEVFYKKNYSRFMVYFSTKYHKSEDYLKDLYMESYEALWNNIHIGRFTLDMLKSSMYSYMLGIAKNMLKANDRKNRELFKVNMFYKAAYSYDESLDIGVQQQLIELDEQNKSDKERAELQEFVTKAIEDLPSRCNQLLKFFYWNRMSYEEIAKEMDYNNADSAKAQKNKCMRKLEQLVENF